MLWCDQSAQKKSQRKEHYFIRYGSKDKTEKTSRYTWTETLPSLYQPVSENNERARRDC